METTRRNWNTKTCQKVPGSVELNGNVNNFLNSTLYADTSQLFALFRSVTERIMSAFPHLSSKLFPVMMFIVYAAIYLELL